MYIMYFNNESDSNSFNLFVSQQFVDTLDVINPCNISRPRDKRGYYFFDSWYSEGLGEQISALCQLYHAQVIICTYVMYCKILEFVPSGILKIIDTHDRMTDRHLFLQKNHIPDEFFSCTREDEANYLSRADMIWARNDSETAYFNELTRSNKAKTVSHFNTPCYLKKETRQVRQFGFLASDNNVNLQLCKEFITQFCKKYSQHPIPIELTIGGNVKKLLEKDPDTQALLPSFPIKLLGKIPQVQDFYELIDLCVCPVTFGTGINVKMIEAMSFGIPLLCTECGIKGVTSPSVYHHNKDVSQVLEQLWKVYDKPVIIAELTTLSERLYDQFYKKQMESFASCFQNATC